MNNSERKLLNWFGFQFRVGRYLFFQEHKSETVSEDIWTDYGRVYYWPGGYNTNCPFLDELTQFEKYIRQLFVEVTDFSYIGHGTGRIVFKKKSTVIKFSRYGAVGIMGDGVEQNRLEWERYQGLGDTLELMPVINRNSRFTWIIMPLSDKLLSEEPEPVQRRVSTRVIESIQSELTITDLKPENIGLYNGSWVVLDYAQPEKEFLPS